jgi:DNA-binding CsgD family transcriptional regulator
MPILGYNELSERELEVLRFYCRGMNRQDIAAHYGLSENTVKGYVRAILSKTGYDSIAKLTMYALANGYIAPQSDGPPERRGRTDETADDIFRRSARFAGRPYAAQPGRFSAGEPRAHGGAAQ